MSDADTLEIRRFLPRMFEKFEIATLVDLPCGDFSWMSKVDLSRVDYIGADSVPETIAENARRHRSVEFRVIDAITTPPPTSDLIFCRGMFAHLTNEQIEDCLDNFVASGARWLITSSDVFPLPETNDDRRMTSGETMPENLGIEPFCLQRRVATFRLDWLYYTLWALDPEVDLDLARSKLRQVVEAVGAVREPVGVAPAEVLSPSFERFGRSAEGDVILPAGRSLLAPDHRFALDPRQMFVVGLVDGVLTAGEIGARVADAFDEARKSWRELLIARTALFLRILLELRLVTSKSPVRSISHGRIRAAVELIPQHLDPLKLSPLLAAFDAESFPEMIGSIEERHRTLGGRSEDL